MSSPAVPLAGLSAVKLALMAKQAREQAGSIARAEPIAIIGIGCRFPGGADSPQQYWQLLERGVDAVREVPADRWDVDAVFDADPAAPGKSSSRHGGFIDQIDRFDAGFFGILPREAERMDPQHRLFLEVASEALDHAGLPHERLAGSNTGVFIASYHSDYRQMQFADRESIDSRTLTGTLHSVLANRLSYLLDLRGPSVALDSACSSSLVAVHLACQSLRWGESDTALAGGVSLIVTPELMIALSKVGFMAPDGRCKTFDELADGFVRGEGCGVVVLRRLSDAIAAGDRVLAVIRGSAVNQDGHSTVLAAPNGLAQQALVREALANAQLTPERIGYVEAHGTGTALGDPIEVEALAATVGRPRSDGSVCLLGAAKANIGHLEAAAGVAGLIKATLVLQHGAVPGQIHFKRLNPHLSLERSCLVVPTTLTPWRAGAHPRCAGVSSFGVGGTNAHVIVEQAPVLGDASSARAPASPRRAQLLALSARSAEALRALARRWIDFLPAAAAPLAELCATAGARRSHHDHRLGVVASSIDELRGRLVAFVEGQADSSIATGQRPVGGPPRLAFVFSGQGSQWLGMGRDLLAEEEVFRRVMADIDARLQPLSGWSLLNELAAGEASSRLDQTEVAQPALFAIQVALVALWKSWGIEPHAVVGHSVGEIAALHVAGVLSIDEAVRVVWHRGRVMQQAAGGGRMAAVALTSAEAEELVRPFGHRLSIGAINSPRGVVLSGEVDALDAALRQLDQRGVSHRSLGVCYAFHSAQMAPCQRELTAALQRVETRVPSLPVYSTVSGALASEDVFDATYFGRNVREPVRLAPAIGAMLDDGFAAFLEIGPHPVLAASIAECSGERGADAVLLATLRRGRPERESLLQAGAALYAGAHTLRWDALHPGTAGVADLPAYPWQRSRHWIRMPPPAAAPVRAGRAVHPLLGQRVRAAAAASRRHEASWPDAAPPWLADHRVGGRLLMPATAMLEALRAAVCDMLGSADAVISAFVVQRPLVLAEAGEAPTIWQTVATTPEHGRTQVELYESVAEEWRLVASAEGSAPRDDEPGPPARTAAACAGAGADDIYPAFEALGITFGPAFRVIDNLRCGDGVAEGWLQSTASDGVAVPAPVLDGALQVCVAAATSTGNDGVPREVLLPLGIERYRVLRPAPARLRVVACLEREPHGGSLKASVWLLAEDGDVVAVLSGVRFAPADAAALARIGRSDDWLHQVVWHPAQRPSSQATLDARGAWVLLADRQGTADALAAALAAAGGRCLRVHAGDALQRVADDVWTADPGEPAHLDAILASAGLPLRGVVHLWSLDIAALDAGVPVIDTARLDHDDLLATGSALHALQAMLRSGNDVAPPLWLVTRGAQAAAGDVSRPSAAGLWGIASVVAVEHPELACRALDLDAEAAADDVAALVAELLSPPGQSQRLALRGSQRLAPRLERCTPSRDVAAAPADKVRLEAGRAGTLDALAWRPASAATPGADEVRVRVSVAGLNFRDVLIALGIVVCDDATLGCECAGVVEAVGSAVNTLRIGDRVFGFAPGSMASEVTVPAAFLARVPAALSLDAAAAVPAAYLTAMYGLERIAELRPGMSVLIHAAAGGVGMAAVQVAQRCGAEIFATAGSPAKRELLRSLGVRQVFDSRSLAFAKSILAATGGRGVDVVLNSLAGDFIPASLGALSLGGCFLELGKRGILSADDVAKTRPDVRYRAYDLGREAAADRGLLGPMLQQLIDGLADGTLRSLPVHAFGFAQAAEAFRFMAQARHTGKLVLRAPGADRAHDAALVRADASYWITGGLGALGLRTARWLVDRGARHLVLSGRSAPSAEARTAIAACESLGAHVLVMQADASDPTAMQAVIDHIDVAMPALAGVVHAAGVLDDGVLQQQTWLRCRSVLRGKAQGARLLHAMTRHLPLDFFVLYSAAGLLLGPAGQGPYAAANAELDALAHARRAAGLPALSVAWGLWSEAGMAARMSAPAADAWLARGLGWIAPADGFERLERLLRDGNTHAAVLPIDWAKFVSRLPPGVDRSFFSAVAPVSSAASTAPPASAVAQWRAAPAGQRRGLVLAHVAGQARQVIGLDDNMLIDPQTPLKEVGLDSLMAVELRNALSRSIGQSLPATLLFDHPSLDALAARLGQLLQLAPVAPPVVREAAPRARAEVAALSETDAEALLIAELDEPAAMRSES